MANIRIISANASDTATLTSSDFIGTLPVTNLQIEGRARVARTANATGDKTINGSWSAANPVIISAVVLYGCNFTAAAKIRVQVWDGTNQTGTLIYDSGLIDAISRVGWGEFGWGILPWGSSLFNNWSSAFSVVWIPGVVPGKSFRITFSDPANAAGYLQIKRLLIGKYFEPAVNADLGLKISWMDNSVQTRTMAGSIRTDTKERFRSITGTLAGLSSGERAAFFDITRAVGLTSELFVSVYPQVGGSQEVDHAMLCKFGSIPENTQIQYARYSGTFNFVEV